MQESQATAPEVGSKNMITPLQENLDLEEGPRKSQEL